MSLNKVILIGNIGRDPEVKYFESGNAIANFTLATNERGYTLPNGTQVPERTDWHNIVVRGERIQFVEKHVKKGSSVLVEGKIRYREYEKDGIRRFVTEIIADKVEFYSTPRRQDGEVGNTTTAAPSNAGASAQTPTSAPAFEGPVENPVDDLPF
jgi:single-strand DNA-binding protein